MASQGMILRNMNLVGGQSGLVAMPEELKKSFEEGCYLILMRWTALQLAIHNEWGGSESKAKAKALYDDVVEWFYTTKGMVVPCNHTHTSHVHACIPSMYTYL